MGGTLQDKLWWLIVRGGGVLVGMQSYSGIAGGAATIGSGGGSEGAAAAPKVGKGKQRGEMEQVNEVMLHWTQLVIESKRIS